MQKNLIIKIGRGKIISKPWNFEAMCLVDDNKYERGAVKTCITALYYLFEGSKATNETIQRLSYNTLNELCKQIWSWYVDSISVLIDIQKNNPPVSNENGGEGLRGLYYAMFRAWGILPGELAVQKPEHIFMLLRSDEKDNAVPDGVAALYGR